MDRSTGTPLGFALLVLLAIGFGWALLGGGEHHTAAALSSFGTSSSVSADFAAEQAQPALVWPQEMPEPMTNYGTAGQRVRPAGHVRRRRRGFLVRRTAARPGSRS